MVGQVKKMKEMERKKQKKLKGEKDYQACAHINGKVKERK